MSVINYLNTDRYILIIINQNRSAIWGTQDSLVKGYRPWPKINPAGNKVAGFEYTKDTALNDVYTFNTLEKAMELLQSYVTELNDMFSSRAWVDYLDCHCEITKLDAYINQYYLLIIVDRH